MMTVEGISIIYIGIQYPYSIAAHVDVHPTKKEQRRTERKRNQLPNDSDLSVSDSNISTPIYAHT